ncbi:MAG TPA: right-handed parallel beta-helix repeat-containing protein, partial [Firmicutes bacterium]|nr:right-handed parallel beta-helix repeat-containing protein [Bacillota bacterium]
MLRKTYLLMVLSALISLAMSCSGSDKPIMPSDNEIMVKPQASTVSGRALWGVYDVMIDTSTLDVTIIPLRTAEFTANVTGFMQPPSSPMHMLSIKIDQLQSDIPNGYIVCDVTLKHPFPGLNQFRGFDVRGICMGDASVSLQHDSSATFAGPDDLTLVNADGYTRWWNPAEFAPHGKILGYIPGGLATKNYTPTARLNGYKYFADGLGVNDPLIINPETRGSFATMPGSNTRRYLIQFPVVAGNPVIHYGYAVDASWSQPDPSGAPDYPIGSFGPDANCAEPYIITVTDAGSAAWYVNDGDNGGFLKLDIEVFDWQAPHNPEGVPGEIVGLILEGEIVSAPVDLLSIATINPGGETSSVYSVEINGLNLTKSGENEIWIIAQSANPVDYEPQIDGDTSMWTYPKKPLSAFLRTTVLISDIQPQQAPVVTSIDPSFGESGELINATVYGNYFMNGCQVELRNDSIPAVIQATNEVFINSGEVTCDFDLSGKLPGLYDVCVINPNTLEGCLEKGFEIKSGCIVYVDDSNTSGIEDGSMSNPYPTIAKGLQAADFGCEVWVDDSGNVYNEQVTLKAGVKLKSVNWDTSDGDDRATIYQDTASVAVIGANNATIEGFEIDGRRYGIDCNGTSPEIIDCRIVNLRYSDCIGIWIRNGSFAHVKGVEIYDLNNATDYGYATFYGIRIDNCDASGDNHVLIEQSEIHYIFSSDILGLGGGYCHPHGIFIDNSDGVKIKNTIVHDVTGGNYYYVYGIRVQNSNDVELVNNVIYN